jgi:hypothetical protein
MDIQNRHHRIAASDGFAQASGKGGEKEEAWGTSSLPDHLSRTSPTLDSKL